MTLTADQPYANSPFQPGVSQDAFIPDQLIGGDLKVVTHAGRTITGGAYYKRGTVLGRITASLQVHDRDLGGGERRLADAGRPVLVDDVDATCRQTPWAASTRWASSTSNAVISRHRHHT